MIASVVGAGNSGAAVVMELASCQKFDRVLVASRRTGSARAAVKDAHSAWPESSSCVAVSSLEEAGAADVIAICAGRQIQKDETASDTFDDNIEIVRRMMTVLRPQSRAVVIVIASPVDQVVGALLDDACHPPERLLGFGGDLDSNRLKSELIRRGLKQYRAIIVGEHGRRVIPILEDESRYDELAAAVGGFLSGLTEEAGPPRNLATGVLLANLMHSVRDDAGMHMVSAVHPNYPVNITWPVHIGRSGIRSHLSIDLPPRARRELRALVNRRLSE